MLVGDGSGWITAWLALLAMTGDVSMCVCMAGDACGVGRFRWIAASLALLAMTNAFCLS